MWSRRTTDARASPTLSVSPSAKTRKTGRFTPLNTQQLSSIIAGVLLSIAFIICLALLWYMSRGRGGITDNDVSNISPPIVSTSRSLLQVSSPLSPSVSVHPDVAQLMKEAVTGLPPIPDIIHFVVGLSHSPSSVNTHSSVPQPFLLQHWLAIRSAKYILNPDSIYCHVQQEPAGEWWDKAKPLCSFILPVRDVTHVFGRPVYHAQHKADILRLEALLNYGGVAVEIDTIIVRNWNEASFRAQHFNVELLLGQAQSTTKHWPDLMETSIIAARKSSLFVKEWYNTYRMFSSRSVATRLGTTGDVLYSDDVVAFGSQLANQMAEKRPHLIQTLSADHWGKPRGLEAEGREKLYREPGHPHDQLYAVHTWQSEHERRRQTGSGDARRIVAEVDPTLQTLFTVKSIAEACALADKSLYGYALKTALLAGDTKEYSC